MEEDTFPLRHKDATLGELHCTVIGFRDKISVNVTKNGRLGRIYHVPLMATIGGYTEYDEELGDEADLLPLAHVTATPVIGSGNTISSIAGMSFASQIASVIGRQAPQDGRVVVVGLAGDIGPREENDYTKAHKQELHDVIKLVEQCRIW